MGRRKGFRLRLNRTRRSKFPKIAPNLREALLQPMAMDKLECATCLTALLISSKNRENSSWSYDLHMLVLTWILSSLSQKLGIANLNVPLHSQTSDVLQIGTRLRGRNSSSSQTPCLLWVNPVGIFAPGAGAFLRLKSRAISIIGTQWTFSWVLTHSINRS